MTAEIPQSIKMGNMSLFGNRKLLPLRWDVKKIKSMTATAPSSSEIPYGIEDQITGFSLNKKGRMKNELSRIERANPSKICLLDFSSPKLCKNAAAVPMTATNAEKKWEMMTDDRRTAAFLGFFLSYK